MRIGANGEFSKADKSNREKRTMVCGAPSCGVDAQVAGSINKAIVTAANARPCLVITRLTTNSLRVLTSCDKIDGGKARLELLRVLR